MKKRQVFGLVVAGLLAGFVSHALAQSATAYSSSAIGVIKKTLPAQKQSLMALPLEQDSDSGSGFVFGLVPAFSNMPNGSVVNFWDITNQVWVSQTKTARSGWGTQKDRIVAAGEAFFMKNAQSADAELVFSGEVPSSESMSKVLPGAAIALIANPYPVATVFTNFSFAEGMANGSIVNFWDESNQAWISQTKTARSGWGTQKDREIKPAEGFFIKSASANVTWTQERPYTWPN